VITQKAFNHEVSVWFNHDVVDATEGSKVDQNRCAVGAVVVLDDRFYQKLGTE
jgi:hypothetical protein